MVAYHDHDFQSYSMFPSLKTVYISGCDLLQFIFPVSFVGGLMKLKEISIKEAPNLKYLFGQSNSEDSSCYQQQKYTQIELPNLKKLELVNISSLINISPDNYCLTCPSLQELSLHTWKYVGFFTKTCSTIASEARYGDYISVKV